MNTIFCHLSGGGKLDMIPKQCQTWCEQKTSQKK